MSLVFSKMSNDEFYAFRIASNEAMKLAQKELTTLETIVKGLECSQLILEEEYNKRQQSTNNRDIVEELIISLKNFFNNDGNLEYKIIDHHPFIKIHFFYKKPISRLDNKKTSLEYLLKNFSGIKLYSLDIELCPSGEFLSINVILNNTK